MSSAKGDLQSPPAAPVKDAVKKTLKDIQSQRDNRNIPLTKVGIRGIRLPAEIEYPNGNTLGTIATIGMFVDLPASERGTHMSRFIQTLHEGPLRLTKPSLEAFLSSIQNRLKSEDAFLDVQFPYFRLKSAPVSGLEGFVDYQIRLHGSLRNGQVSWTTEIQVPIATLCPCSKAISEYGAHNQRGIVTLQYQLSHPIENEWDVIIQHLEQSGSCELYSVLKRPDEKAVTERAYENPVFVEDVVRNVAMRLEGLEMMASFQIEAENFESIHNHNAYAQHIRPPSS